jgi:hypothetical protein
MSELKFKVGQTVRIKEGSFPLNNPDGYGLIGQLATIIRSWDPRRGTGAMNIARSEDIQFFELNQYDVHINGNLYSLNEDWLEAE